MKSAEGPSRGRNALGSTSDVDAYGLPAGAFGEPPPAEFFEVLGRLLAVNGKIEYLQDRLGHLPSTETNGTRKVEQFVARCSAGNAERSTVVHSRWVFGAHTTDPGVFMAIRYKTRKQTSGEAATVSIIDVSGSDREQDYTPFTLNELRQVLRRSITTMRIGEHAYAQAMLKWAGLHADADSSLG